jgi:hypothetical protein
MSKGSVQHKIAKDQQNKPKENRRKEIKIKADISVMDKIIQKINKTNWLFGKTNKTYKSLARVIIRKKINK